MNPENLKYRLRQNIKNIRGWSTNRKILIFESDDWGSERTPSKSKYNYLLDNGLRVDQCPYSKFDTIASNNDLIYLFDVLSKFKDKNGRNAIFTANFNTANPDYNKIKEDRFNSYFYRTLPETLKDYPESSQAIQLWNEGIKHNIFIPQYHHREHLSPSLWLQQIRDGHKVLNIGFKAGVYALSRATSPSIKQLHLAGLFYIDEAEKSAVIDALEDGIKLFEEIFSYKPDSFIAPVYIWTKELEKSFINNGLKYIQGHRLQMILDTSGEKISKKINHFLGEKGKYGQLYTLRNCSFEPSIEPNLDHIDYCMQQINIAFKWGKPATISTHRVNYIGSLEENNRDKNLRLLTQLLNKIVSKYPNIEFMSSNELGHYIKQNK